MTKELLLSLVHNASTQLTNEMVALNDDILFLQNELSVSKNKYCSDLVKKKTNTTKEQNLKQLSAFLTKYVMLLLDKREGNAPSGCYYSHVMSRNDGIASLMEGMDKADTSKEYSTAERLKDLCQKRSALEDMLRLLQMSEVEKLSDDKSQEVFSDLMLQLKSSILGGAEHLFSRMRNSGEGAKFRCGKASDNGGDNNNDGGDYNNDDGDAARGERSSTAASEGSGINSSREGVSDLEEASGASDVHADGTLSGESPAKNSSLNRHISEKGSPLNWKSNTEERLLPKSCSLTSPFLKKQQKVRNRNNPGDSSLEKFNLMRKCFSNTNVAATSFLFERDRKKNEGAADIPTRISRNEKSKIPIFRKSSLEESVHLQNKHTNVAILKGHIEKCSPKFSVNSIPRSINKTGKNVCTRKGNNQSNGEAWEERDQLGSFDSLSSSSSDASESRGPRRERTGSGSQGGRKKYLIRINKKGHGSFEVKKEGANSSGRVYDFEVVYEGVDGVVDSMDAAAPKQRTRKQLVHLSFLRKGEKICGVERLHIGDIELVRSLHFGSTTKGGPRDEDMDGVSAGDQLMPRRRKGRTKKEAYKRISLLEENLKNLREENFRKKYELTRIIDDIKKKKMKDIATNMGDNHDGEAEPYNMEFVETNRLRGLYIHMLDKQGQLERDKNFYKNELEKLQQDIKNDAAPLADFLREEKKKFIQREKEFYKKEKKYFQVKNQLKKKVIHLQNELEIADEKLNKERELNKSLKNTITEKVSVIEKKDCERRNSERENESKIKILNTELQELMDTVVVEKTEKNKLQEEISLIRKDMAFDNFKKVVLEKITKTNCDIKYLAEILELLTKELENKISKEKCNDRHLRELKEECSKKEQLLSSAEDKINEDMRKMRKMKEEIAYLHEKNRNLVESVKYMVSQGVEGFPNDREVITLEGGRTISPEEGYYCSSDERSGVVVLPPRETSQIAESNDTAGRNRKGRRGCRPSVGKRRVSKNKQSFTSFSDNSSLFLCHDMDTKRGYSSDELTSGAGDPARVSAHVGRGLIRHSLR